MVSRILVATDGTPGAVGALALARALLGPRSDAVRVVGVVEPLIFSGVGAAYPAPAPDPELERREATVLLERIEAQVLQAAGEDHRWSVAVEMGSIPATIVREAREFGAALIALGIGRHSPAERWLGGEMALSVVRVSPLPVFAAQPTLRDRPRSALAAVDFSDFSLEAVRLAGELLQPGDEIHLAHVLGSRLMQAAEWGRTYREGARIRLTELGGVRPSLRALVHLPEGDPARELLELAERVEADVLIAGTHGYGFLGRLLMGSVSTRLLRAASCSVLLVPPATLEATLPPRSPSAEAVLPPG